MAGQKGLHQAKALPAPKAPADLKSTLWGEFCWQGGGQCPQGTARVAGPDAWAPEAGEEYGGPRRVRSQQPVCDGPRVGFGRTRRQSVMPET